MQIEIVTLEVDGSLRNPVVLATVLLWGVLLALATALVVRSWMRSSDLNAANRPRRLLLSVALGVLYLGTPAIQFLIGNILYQLVYASHRESLASVGFWGGPPIGLAWCLGVCGGAAAFLLGRGGVQAMTEHPRMPERR